MEIDLSSLSLEQSKEFVDHFNANIRKKNDTLLGPTGSTNFDNDGATVYLDDTIVVDEERFTICWKLRMKHTGELLSASVERTENAPKGILEKKAYEFLNSILIHTISSNRQRFYIRTHYTCMSGSNLEGEYWIKGKRVAPQFPEDNSSLIDAERYIVLDQEVDAIDGQHAREIAEHRAYQYACRISLLTEVGLQKPKFEYRYCLKNFNGEIVQERESTQHIDRWQPSTMPAKAELCDLGQFRGSVFDDNSMSNNRFVMPRETRKIFRGLDGLSTRKKEAFDRCANMYRLGLVLGPGLPTVKLSYFYGAIDAIIKTVDEDLDMTKFMDAYGDPGGVDVVREMGREVRSAHWHSGEMKLGETDFRSDYLTNPQGLIRSAMFREGQKHIRNAIFKWCLSEIG